MRDASDSPNLSLVLPLSRRFTGPRLKTRRTFERFSNLACAGIFIVGRSHGSVRAAQDEELNVFGCLGYP